MQKRIQDLIQGIKEGHLFLGVGLELSARRYLLEVKATTGEGNLVVGPVGDKENTIITTPEMVRNGGVVESEALGKIELFGNSPERR